MKFPTGLLHNTRTDRWHPVVFYASPLPSEAGERVCRHFSRETHTAGFATRAEAADFVRRQDDQRFVDAAWNWDGIEFRQFQWYFDRDAEVAA